MWSHTGDRFTDLSHYDRIFLYIHQTRFFTDPERFAYPAPAALLYDALLQFGRYRLAVYIALCVSLLVLPGVALARALVRRGPARGPAALFLAVLVLTSWPLLFLIERANIEAVVILFTFVASLAYWRDRPHVAALFWGLAASVKIYPVLMLALFLNRRQISAFLLGMATAAASLGLSFWFIGPTIRMAVRGTIEGVGGFVSTYADIVRAFELRFDHSLLALLKVPVGIRHLRLSTDYTLITHLYLVAAGAMAFYLYVSRARHLPRVHQFMLLSMAMTVLPPVSYDYTLMHLYPAFVFLVLAAVPVRRPADAPALRRMFWCFVLLLSPMNFAFFRGLHLNGPLKAVALVVACATLLRQPLRAFGTAAEATWTAMPGETATPLRAGAATELASSAT